MKMAKSLSSMGGPIASSSQPRCAAACMPLTRLTGDWLGYVLLRILARMRPITPQKEVNSSHDPQLLEQL